MDAEFEPLRNDAANDCFEMARQRVFQNMAKRRSFEHEDNLPKEAFGYADNLYHYTTGEGLQGIIEQCCLHASAASYLNDSSEMYYGCKLFSSVFNHWIEVHAKQEDSLRISLLQQIHGIFENPSFMQPMLARTYVVCFCEEENLLSQWRAYGPNGGYSIGFRREALEHGLKTEGNLYHIKLERVTYRESVQRRILDHILSDTLPVTKEPELQVKLNGLSPLGKTHFQALFLWLLTNAAFDQIVRFKHPAFAEEREWRLVMRPFNTPPHPEESRFLGFKSSRGILTPHLKLKSESGVLPITSVRYGPTLEKNRTENSLRLLFRKHGYSGVQFHGSDIPVRL